MILCPSQAHWLLLDLFRHAVNSATYAFCPKLFGKAIVFQPNMCNKLVVAIFEISILTLQNIGKNCRQKGKKME